jgi:isocitrate/isopropylmalate dehydrogenase
MAISLLVLDGDGIGPEICAATEAVLRAADARFELGLEFAHAPIGFTALEAQGSTFPDSTWAKCQAVDGIVLGPVSHNDYPPKAQGGLNPSGELRIRLDLFANIRPARTHLGVPHPSRHEFDLVIVRENTEGFYADRSMFMGPGEYMPTPDVALATRKVTRHASLRIAEQAFALAVQRHRKVTAVHKSNVMRISDGLFLECVRSVAARYPNVEYEEQLVDAMAALLVRDASKFDVIVATNMFGDILSDEAAELSGGLGLAASLNAGTERAVAQAQHGSAPSIAGQDRANPCSLIVSAAMLLAWLGERREHSALLDAARRIEQAVEDAIADPAMRTADLGGVLGTKEFAQIVAGMVEA